MTEKAILYKHSVDFFGQNNYTVKALMPFSIELIAVSVAQLVEQRVVVPWVVGSSPIAHPMRKESETFFKGFR